MNTHRDHVNKIINKFINNSKLMLGIGVYNPGDYDEFILESHKVLMVIVGYVELTRRKDNIVIASFEGPHIINICASGILNELTFNKESNFSYLSCDRNDFYAYISEQDLWADLFRVLEHSVCTLYSRIDILIHGCVYDSVKYHLYKLNAMPVLRQKENVCQYIVKRTGFSKSGVMAILNELMKGEYIEMTRGKLTALNELPGKF